jgi:iron complex transport system permease protein
MKRRTSSPVTPRLIFVAFIALIPVSILVSLGLGRYPIPLVRVAGIVFSRVLPLELFWTSTDARVVLLIRAPRVLTAVIVGAGLAASGAVLQGVFRNPLVGPQIIGISAGSGFGGALAILVSGSQVVTMIGAFVFGLVSIVLVFFLSRSGKRSPLLMLVLAGVIVSSFFTALTSFVTYVADPYDKLPAIVVWLMGSFVSASYKRLLTAAIPVGAGVVWLFLLGFRINVISLGDEEAEAIGVNVDRTRWFVLIAVAVITSATVSVAGVIGWIGLVVPHIARMVVGSDQRKLIPTAAVLGGTYTVWVDNFARAATASEIPLGIITAILGAPVFGYLLKRMQNKGWKSD